MTYTKKQGRRTLSFVGLEIPTVQGALPAAALLADGLVPGANNHIAGSDAFKARVAAMALGSLRDMAEPERYAFSVKYQPLFGFTDMVQYIGIWKGVREEALPYAKEYVLSLLREDAQKKLESLYAFPVRPLESIYDADATLKLYARELVRAGVPRAFSYAKRREEWTPLAKAALDGDANAHKALLDGLDRACLRPPEDNTVDETDDIT